MPGMRAAPIKQGTGGGFVSAKSKTGDPACSAAMSVWVLTRAAGATPPDVFKVLAQCRAQAKAGKQAQQHRAAGSEGKAQRLESQVAKDKAIEAVREKIANLKKSHQRNQF